MNLRRNDSDVIRPCVPADFERLLAIINDAAEAYRNVIPEDCYHQPYMPARDLRAEISAGVVFSGCERGGELAGAMGAQPVRDVSLIRHAYVSTAYRRQGIGAKLLVHLMRDMDRPVLVGTWAAAAWAIEFYCKHGFEVVPRERQAPLLRKYWNVSERQIETSVVLADRRALGMLNPRR